MTEFNVPSTALLLMDFQKTIINRFGEAGTALIPKVAAVKKAAEAAGMLVIMVRVAFRPGYPEISDNNARFSGVKTRGALSEDDPESAIHEALAPNSGESVVTKHRVSAFRSTSLEQLLNAKDIKHVVLAGVATSGCVLSTFVEASDRDFKISVIEDCCLDADAEITDFLMKRIFSPNATILSSKDFISSL
jgi:hypothetical protein